METNETKLQYYLKQPYTIKIDTISEEEGGGFFASLPQFGTMGITGDGDTIEEAVAMLMAFKEIQFKKFIKENKEIPDATQEKQLDNYSGRILLRTPRELHKDIAMGAIKNGVSQNQFANLLLTKAMGNIQSTNIEELLKKVNVALNQVFTVLHSDYYKTRQYENNISIERKNKHGKRNSNNLYPADAYNQAA